MSQWGQVREFAEGDTRVKAIPHVETSGFESLHSEAPIAQVIAVDAVGPEPFKLIEKLRCRYAGKPYREWLRVDPW